MNTKLFVATMLVVGSALTMAQESKPIGLSVRGGPFFPTANFGRNEGKTWFGFGADYRLANAKMGSMMSNETSHIQLSVDFRSKGDLSTVPIMVNYVIHNKELFYSAGAGVSFDRDYTIVANARSKRNKVGGAFQVGIGYEFQKGTTPFFLEGRYFFHTNSNFNGVGVFAGIRL